MTTADPDDNDHAEARAFLSTFKELVERLLHEMPSSDDGPRLLDVLEEHLGVRPHGLAVTSEEVPHHRMVDADIAMAEVAVRDPDHRLVGLGGGMERHHFTLGDQLQHARMGRGGGIAEVDYVQTATGPGPADRNVVALGLWLFRFRGCPVVVRQQSPKPQQGRPMGSLDILSPDQELGEALVAQLRALMDERSVFRGQVVTFSADPYGHGLAGVTFVERPTLKAADVVLPDDLLDRVSEHVSGIARHRDALRAHHQHLKRGVLLYGPPGTGKTHTMRYLLSASPGTTAILLSGGSLQYIHDAAKVARAHQPAIVVLEDCDLIAGDRSFGPGYKPLLFEVLDALDGLDSDADVAFLLTTNRVEDLERALTQRPGRVDLAAEIPLPDETGRAALLRLYAGELFSAEAVADASRQAAGTTASFAKELVRRAVLLAASAGEQPADAHLSSALEALQSDREALTRSLLGSEPGGGEPLGRPGLDRGPYGPGPTAVYVPTGTV